MSRDATAGARAWARAWGVELLVGLVILVQGVREVAVSTGSSLVVPVVTAVVVVVARRAPLAALAGAWLLGAWQLTVGGDVVLVELSLAWVLFAGSRWGRPVTVFLSGLTIPTAAGLGIALAARGYSQGSYGPLGTLAERRSLVDLLTSLGRGGAIGGAIVAALAVLALPWLAGLALRFSGEATEARRASEQAVEIARLREEQARLSGDVHDVVGHSLAVILAQAQSAQYLPDHDLEKMRATMENIATTARASLQDVRQVLAGGPASGAGTPAPARPLDDLLEGVRGSGTPLESVELGTAAPLPPELETVAYRVLQEMLTNALRHGRRDAPVHVERAWPDASGDHPGLLRITVRNEVGAPTSLPDGGAGLAGMRRRLEAVGGRLDVGEEGSTFVVTAWLPVRSQR